FHEFFEDESSLYLVTELCDGGDFAELNHGINDPVEVKQLIRDMVMAISYCHDHGVAHRDLKFENCLIQRSASGQRLGKVIDFGLSSIRRPGERGNWLNDQLGTRFFVAPEVIDRSVEYGVKCDCWSMGVMLYIILTDEHPCCQDAHKVDTTTLFRKILQARLREGPLEDASVDSDAVVLLKGLLTKSADHRMTAQDALNSAWLCQVKDSKRNTASLTQKGSPHFAGIAESINKVFKNKEESGSPLRREDLKRLSSFRGYSRFERLVMTLVAHQSEEKDVAELRDIFVELDTQRTGSLCKEEVREGIRPGRPCC
ncbi:unnamed protein product, partial [Polarella glacialis]